MENIFIRRLPNFDPLDDYFERKAPVRGSNYEYSNAALRRCGDAISFKNWVKRIKNKNSIETKAYISSDVCSRPQIWEEDLCGIPRISLHGIDSICVVLRKEDFVSLRHQVQKEDLALYKINEEYWNQEFHRDFMSAMIYEVEELAAPCYGSIEKLQTCASGAKHHISMPFGVVSWNLSNMVRHKHEASFDEARHAVNFLQEEMKSDTAFTFITTVKTAVSALQHLFGKMFKANEIEVFVLRSDDGIPKPLLTPFVRYEPRRLPPTSSLVKKMQMHYHGRAEEIPTRAERGVKDYLTLANKRRKY